MIERIYVNNFRCFENFSLDFAGRESTLIIGKNGSGKSTLRHVFGLFQNICRGSSRARDLIAEGDFTQNRRQIPMRFEVELVLRGRRFQYTISFDMPEKFSEPRIVEENLKVDRTILFDRQESQVTLADGSVFRLDWHVIALPIINEKPGETSVSEIKSFFAAMILLAPLPSHISGYSDEESTELQQEAGNFSSFLRAMLSLTPSAYGTLAKYLKEMIPEFSSLAYLPTGGRGKQLLVRFQGSDSRDYLSVEFGQLSDGEKCFFLGALIAAVNKDNGPIFCMWDEPDNHLSLPEVGHFTTHLRKMTNHGGQWIATSHHPETIRKFSDENTVVFTRESHLEPTIARTLSDLSHEGDLIEALLYGEIIG